MRIHSILAFAFLATACRADLPDARFGCAADEDCPGQWSCWSSDHLCHRDVDPNVLVDAGDSGVDAGDSGFDAGPPPCVPTGSADVPDVDRVDADCDGIDGALADSVFVDGASGSDGAAGTREAPVATIAKGLALAVAESKHALLLANATYEAQITLVDGIGIHGGYEPTLGWRRSAISATQSTILTATSSPVVFGSSLVAATRVSGVRIVAPDASTAGGSSVALRLVDVTDTLSIEHSTLRGGQGEDGTAGTTPTAPRTIGNTGPSGSPAKKGPSSAFSSNPFFPTPAVCGCGEGGMGAFGYGSTSATARDGLGGSFVNGTGNCVDAATGGSTLPSEGAAAGSINSVNPGRNGDPGPGGSAGAAGGYAAAVAEAGYVPVSAGTAGDGRSGGGGGGGASGLAWVCQDGSSLVPPSAGNGGGGGCGGAGGTGGNGGGASIALYLWRSTPTLIGVTLITSTGGTGGDGGFGQNGAMGGPGGPAGTNSANVSCDGQSPRTSSAGGSGGYGGPGGRGGGGAGGLSSAIVFGTSSSLGAGSTLVTTTPGAGGPGGAGGEAGLPGGSCAVFRVSDASCLASIP